LTLDAADEEFALVDHLVGKMVVQREEELLMPDDLLAPGVPFHRLERFELLLREARVAMAFGLVLAEVPGATPKKPASGLIARKWPSASGRIQAMSSPTVQTFHPFC
jgi:hypothetical protein